MPVPAERDFFGSLNTIHELIESTCEDKWHILLETALPAAGEALWILLIPSPEEILENYLNPRDSRKRRKRAAGGSGKRQLTRYGQLRWWQKIGFPDIDQIIADHLPGAEAIRGRKVGPLEQWFWQGIDVIDRGLWYWLLLDISKTFVVEWASGIVESRFCSSPFLGLFVASGDARPISTGQGPWQTAGDVLVATNLGWRIDPDGVLERENTSIEMLGQVVWFMTATRSQFPGAERKARLRILVREGGITRETWTSNFIDYPFGTATEFSLSIKPNEAYDELHFVFDSESGGAPTDPRQWNISVFASEA